LRSPYRFAFKVGVDYFCNLVDCLRSVGLQFIPRCFRGFFLLVWENMYGRICRTAFLKPMEKERGFDSSEVHLCGISMGGDHWLGVPADLESDELAREVVGSHTFILHAKSRDLIPVGTSSVFSSDPVSLLCSFRVPEAVKILLQGFRHVTWQGSVREPVPVELSKTAIQQGVLEHLQPANRLNTLLAWAKVHSTRLPLIYLGKEGNPNGMSIDEWEVRSQKCEVNSPVAWVNMWERFSPDLWKFTLANFRCICYELSCPPGMYSYGCGYYTNGPTYERSWVAAEESSFSFVSQPTRDVLNSFDELGFFRCTPLLFSIQNFLCSPNKLVRRSNPDGVSPFLCETVMEYLYWVGEKKTKLFVLPMGVVDPPVSHLPAYETSTLVVLRTGTVYVTSMCSLYGSGSILQGHTAQYEQGRPGDMMFFTSSFGLIHGIIHWTSGEKVSYIFVHDDEQMCFDTSFCLDRSSAFWAYRLGPIDLWTPFVCVNPSPGFFDEDGFLMAVRVAWNWHVPPPKPFFFEFKLSPLGSLLSSSVLWEDGEWDRIKAATAIAVGAGACPCDCRYRPTVALHNLPAFLSDLQWAASYAEADSGSSERSSEREQDERERGDSYEYDSDRGQSDYDADRLFNEDDEPVNVDSDEDEDRADFFEDRRGVRPEFREHIVDGVVVYGDYLIAEEELAMGNGIDLTRYFDEDNAAQDDNDLDDQARLFPDDDDVDDEHPYDDDPSPPVDPDLD